MIMGSRRETTDQGASPLRGLFVSERALKIGIRDEPPLLIKEKDGVPDPAAEPQGRAYRYEREYLI